MKTSDIKKELRALITPGKAEILSRFFKTGKGEYGEGDVFIGVMVPQIRIVAKKYKDIDLKELQKLRKNMKRGIRNYLLISKKGKFSS